MGGYISNLEREESLRKYRISKGETLYSIAKRYKVSVNSVMKANSTLDPRDIRIGTIINIPASSSIFVDPSYNASVSAKTKGRQPTVAAVTPDTNDTPIVYDYDKGKSVPKLIWPISNPSISSEFGIRGNAKHDGIDIRASKNSPIHAAADGVVIFSGKGPTGYGNVVIIKHNVRYITVYAHTNMNYVNTGDKVKRGVRIAAVGNTGRSSGYHLHFELRKDRESVDPRKYLPSLK